MDDEAFTEALSERVWRGLSGRGLQSLPGMLGTAFGLGPRGGIDVEAASRTLGVSRSTVYRWLAGGQPRDLPRVEARTLAAAAYGIGPRGGVNVTAAAAQLGVSRSTVYRWLAGQAPPARMRQLAGAARSRVASSPTGRAAAAAAARTALAARMARDPRTGAPIPPAQQRARITIAGVQNVSKLYADTDPRFRRVQFDLTPAQVDGLYDIWEAEGERGAVRYLENATSALYRGTGFPDESPERFAAETPPDDPYAGWWIRSIDTVEFE